MSALAQIPVHHWLRLGLLLVGLFLSLGLLCWLVSRLRRQPTSQKQLIAAFASDDPTFFADFANDIGQIAIRFFCGTQRCLCRMDNPGLDAKQQALFAQCCSAMEALGFVFTGFLVPAIALQRVDEPTVLFIFLDQERRVGAAVSCRQDALVRTELESERLDGEILGTVLSQEDSTDLLDSPPTVQREIVSIDLAEALSLHRRRMVAPDDFRAFASLDDVMASQRRQEAQRIRHTLSKGAPGFEGVGQLVSQQMPWYCTRSAREEMARQIDRRMLDWRASPAEVEEAARIVAEAPYTIGVK